MFSGLAPAAWVCPHTFQVIIIAGREWVTRWQGNSNPPYGSRIWLTFWLRDWHFYISIKPLPGSPAVLAQVYCTQAVPSTARGRQTQVNRFKTGFYSLITDTSPLDRTCSFCFSSKACDDQRECMRSTTALQPLCGPKERSAERLVYVSVISLEEGLGWGAVRETCNVHRVLCHQGDGEWRRRWIGWGGEGVEDGKASIKPIPVWPHLWAQRHLLVIWVLFRLSHAYPEGRSHQLYLGAEEGWTMV